MRIVLLDVCLYFERLDGHDLPIDVCISIAHGLVCIFVLLSMLNFKFTLKYNNPPFVGSISQCLCSVFLFAPIVSLTFWET